MSELNDVLQSGYYESPLGYDTVDLFVDEVIKLENKTNSFVGNNEKGITMTGKEVKVCEKNIIYRFRERENGSNEIIDNCHLTDKNREDQQKNVM